VPDHHDCEFGHWFGKAPDHLQELKVFQELGDYHKAIHEKVVEIINLHNGGDHKKAKMEIEEFENVRKKMFESMDELYIS